MITETMMARATWAWDPFANPEKDEAPTTIADTLCPYCDGLPDDDHFCRNCQEYAA